MSEPNHTNKHTHEREYYVWTSTEYMLWTRVTPGDIVVLETGAEFGIVNEHSTEFKVEGCDHMLTPGDFDSRSSTAGTAKCPKGLTDVTNGFAKFCDYVSQNIEMPALVD